MNFMWIPFTEIWYAQWLASHPMLTYWQMSCVWSVSLISCKTHIFVRRKYVPSETKKYLNCHLAAQRYQLNYGEPMPCEQLVSYLCDIKQAYTQYGGKRPFGVSILYMGWDKHYGYQLYQSDPSGNYGGWKATCIGNNSGVSSIYTSSPLSYMNCFFIDLL